MPFLVHGAGRAPGSGGHRVRALGHGLHPRPWIAVSLPADMYEAKAVAPRLDTIPVRVYPYSALDVGRAQ